jgi:thiol-disulfide isomerase/thioredoxin
MCPPVPKGLGRFGRTLLLATVALGCAAGAAPAAGAARQGETFDALKREYEEAREKYMEERRQAADAAQRAAAEELKAAKKALGDAKTDEEKQAARKRLQKASAFPAMRAVSPADGPGATFSPRFLAFAVKNPRDPAAVDAYFLALLTSGGPTGKAQTWGRAVKALQDGHVADPGLRKGIRLFRVLAGARDEAADRFLRDVLDRNPDRRARGRSCQALAQGRANAARLGESLKANAELRRNAEALLGSKEGVERLIAAAPSAKKEAEELARTLRAEYDDVCPDLSVGKPAPEVVSQDVDGRPVKLSALKGKVVILDIWATWCAPCKAMIPHEREMVGRLKGKPFALVSISADEKKETLTKFLAREKMPWTHWWNGHEGGILEDWDIQGYPTIYVLDARGVIRSRDLRGEQLEEAVNKLLEEHAKGAK